MDISRRRAEKLRMCFSLQPERDSRLQGYRKGIQFEVRKWCIFHVVLNRTKFTLAPAPFKKLVKIWLSAHRDGILFTSTWNLQNLPQLKKLEFCNPRKRKFAWNRYNIRVLAILGVTRGTQAKPLGGSETVAKTMFSTTPEVQITSFFSQDSQIFSFQDDAKKCLWNRWTPYFCKCFGATQKFRLSAPGHAHLSSTSGGENRALAAARSTFSVFCTSSWNIQLLPPEDPQPTMESAETLILNVWRG